MVFGVVLLIIGFVAGIPILWTLGLVVLVVGVVLFLVGSAGHAVGGRRRRLPVVPAERHAPRPPNHRSRAADP